MGIRGAPRPTPLTLAALPSAFDGMAGRQGTMNEFRDPAYTNLHTHGLHDSPGSTCRERRRVGQPEDVCPSAAMAPAASRCLFDCAAAAGAFSQDTAEEYVGADNIFVNIPGKLYPTDDPAQLAMSSVLPPDHMPGCGGGGERGGGDGGWGSGLAYSSESETPQQSVNVC